MTEKMQSSDEIEEPKEQPKDTDLNALLATKPEQQEAPHNEETGEVIEAQVMGTSPLSGELIRDINWPEGAMVGAVIKRGEILVPKGDTRIEEGDILVVFALSADIPVIEKLFQVNIEFF